MIRVERFFIWKVELIAKNRYFHKKFLEQPFGARQVIAERVPFHGHANGFRKGFENGFDLVVLVLSVTFDVQVASRRVREGFEKMEEHLRRHFPDHFSFEFSVPYDPATAA